MSDKKYMTFYLSPETSSKVERLAASIRVPRSRLIEMAVDYLDQSVGKIDPDAAALLLGLMKGGSSE